MHHMDISYLHVQIVYVFLDFLLESQGGHMHHMDISFLHGQIVYVFLDVLFGNFLVKDFWTPPPLQKCVKLFFITFA